MFRVQATSDANPDFGVIQGDIKNGYNEICGESVLATIKGTGKLDETLAFSHALMEPVAYVDMGGGIGLVEASFKCEGGMYQGAVERGCFFLLGCNKTFQTLQTKLQDCDRGVTAIIDDNYTLGLMEAISTALQQFGVDIREVGLQLQPTKSQ